MKNVSLSSDRARPLLALVLLLQAAHVVVVAITPSSFGWTNLLQLLIPGLAAVLSFVQYRNVGRSWVERRCWRALSAALAIWTLGQAVYMYLHYMPVRLPSRVHPADALWLLFGLPLLLAVTNAQAGTADRVAWLDQAQAIFFFAVLYLLVLLPSGNLSLTRAYLIQNVALVLCCLLRLQICSEAGERRFFSRLALFLMVYSSLETFGDWYYAHYPGVGGFADLVWTIPFTLLSLSVLRQRSEENDLKVDARLLRAVQSMQGLSLATLTFLCMGISVLLATRKPWLGGICVAVAFILFALRTDARERLWFAAHGRLEESVRQDPLTGLGNRVLLRKHLSGDFAENDGPKALLFLDLDRFKHINDTLGHGLGDQLLIEIAGRLRAAAPNGSQICRLGGDEFVVLAPVQTPEAAREVGNGLLAALGMPVCLGSHEIRCTASIGAVVVRAGEDPDHVLRTADHAMYRAKQLGKNRVQLFDAKLQTQMIDRWSLEAELRECVAANGIGVAFQPIYSVEEGSICGFEALARWSHPERGNVPPLDFIRVAEESGLILPLGAQILQKACEQMAKWNTAWDTEFSVSVNVSPHQFADAGLIPWVLSMLERTGLSPRLLRLEITETALLLHESIVKHALAEARAHGIRISLDDFGTGYSSLSFLLTLPVDEVKVDRSFVSHMHQDPNREELVRTVIHLGQSLGKRVIAEGVETEQDLRGLARMGCECVQGYLISRPLFAHALETDLSAIATRGRELMENDPDPIDLEDKAGVRDGWTMVSEALQPEAAALT